MNQEIMHTEEQTGPSLANFPFFSAETLKELASTLGLFMGVPELRFCQEHYRTILRRDPSVEELLMIDGMVKNGYRKADCFLLSEMTTESETVAGLFSELMTHRSHKFRETKRPIALTDLADIVTTFAEEADDPILADTVIRFTPDGDLLLAAEGYQRVVATGNAPDDASVGIRVATPQKEALCAGDYVYAIPDRADTPSDGPQAEFLLNHIAAGTVKQVKILQEEGLLSALADLNCGAVVRPQKLLGNETFTLPDLTAPQNGILFAASPAKSADLLLDAMDKKIPIVLVAKVKKNETVQICQKNKSTEFSTAFLRSLAFSRAYHAIVSAPSPDGVSVSLSRRGTCTVKEKKYTLAKSTASGTSPYHAAILGAVVALSQCICAGGHLSETKLDTYVALPLVRPTAERMGESLAAILGLYRVFKAFSLAGAAPMLDLSDKEHAEIRTVALSPISATPPAVTIQKTGSDIYYLEPLRTADGLPDLDDLKKMYGYIEKLIADGKVLSIRPTGDNHLAALKAMSRDLSVEYLLDTPITSHVGGFLIETDQPTQGLKIAKTESEAPPCDEISDKSETDS